jgi:hypothetical protein
MTNIIFSLLPFLVVGLNFWPATVRAQEVPIFKILNSSVVAPHKAGTLVRDGKAIYLIGNGQKRGFLSLNEFLSYRYRLSRIVIANEGDKLLVEGPPMRAKPGTFALDISDGRTIYLIGKNGEKRGFASAEAFRKHKHKKRGLVIWPINLSDYPTGSVIK